MSLTAANAIILLSVQGVFSSPQRLQGFSADDVFGTDSITPAEVSMGIDGKLSGGFVNVPTVQKFILQADSRSNDIFDNWYAQQKAANEVFQASGFISLPALGKKYTMVTGFLTAYMPLPDAKKKLEPRTFGITWESALPALL